MTPLHPRPAEERRGAALLLSFLVLIVIIAIVHQIYILTKTDEKVAHNDITRTLMDLAIESAQLQVMEQLREDGEAAMASEAEGNTGQDPPPTGPDSPDSPDAAGSGDAVDSKMDEWALPQSTSINEMDLRILIQDEDSKYNVLNMLVEDEEEAQFAYERVARILDNCREGTQADIDGGRADEMARAMRDHMTDRINSILPRTTLLTDDEENDGMGLPLTLREFVVLEPFEEQHFQDFFDEDEVRVHSIESFLTIYSAPFVGESGSPLSDAEGGYGVNVNTAPLAVLHSLADSRDVDPRFWEDVLEYRNEEEDPPEGDTEELEPMLDEFGNELLRRKFFDDLEELSEVYGWDNMEPDIQAMVEGLLTTQSNVFSVYITARVSTADESIQMEGFETRREQELYERSGKHISRTVRAIFWRRQVDDEMQIVTLQRWQVIDYAPMEVLDYPEDE